MISKFMSHVVPGVIRPLHSLWNEVVGFFFLLFTAMAAYYVFKAVRAFEGDIDGLFRIILPGLFGLVMGYYGVSSFLKARKISRS